MTMADPDIPIAYGTPVMPPPQLRTSASAPVAPVRDLQAATALNGGRSSRVMLPPPNDAPSIPQSTYEALADQGYTRGLSMALVKNKMAFPLAFWVVDNSGSMNTQDGHRLVVDKRRKSNVRLVACTRWKEMQQTVDYHAQMAALLQNPTVFRLLNDPGRVNGPQQFGVCERGPQHVDHDLAVAQQAIMNTQPSGVTPLTDHVREIRSNILELEPTLRANGTKVVIVLATDGKPTDYQGYATGAVQQEFVRALKQLEGLPVWIVVRLCTDDDDVVEYWNELDGQLELSLEVLDDFSAEAAEVYEHNKWLNYGLPIHRMRELGFYHRLFDLLDERMLSKDELRDFFRLLFGDGKMDGVPDADEDWKGFVAAISRLVNEEEKQWNPMTQKMEPWINMSQLKKDYGGGWGIFGW